MLNGLKTKSFGTFNMTGVSLVEMTGKAFIQWTYT